MSTRTFERRFESNFDSDATFDLEHPALHFYQLPTPTPIERSKKLYLVPTTHGDVYDPDFSPIPTSPDELPEINRWTLAYVMSVIEILAGRRSLLQISRSTHRFTYNTIAAKIGMLRDLPKIRRIHRHEPIEGVVEVTVTLNFKERVRVLVARFEGVDRKWLCTEFEIL